MRLLATRLTATITALFTALAAVSLLLTLYPGSAKATTAPETPARPRVVPAWPDTKPNGSYMVAYARVDDLSSSSITFTNITGLAVTGIGSKISSKKSTGKIDKTLSKTALSKVAVGGVVSVSGYVVDKSHVQSYMAYAGCTPTKYGCTPNYIPASRWVEDYDLYVTSVQPLAGSKCASSQRVKVPVKWDFDPKLSVQTCVVQDAVWVLPPEVDDYRYFVTSLNVELSRTDIRRIPLIEGQWGRVAGLLPRGTALAALRFTISCDVKDDGKPPYILPLPLV